MLAAALPHDEDDRLAALHSLELLDTPAEERFDRITRMAQRLFDVPIALISLVDHGRQWFKSAQGLAARETPRDVSFCGHAIHAGDVFVVEDALADPRFADNPLVTGPPGVRFYAGAPLATAGGFRIGTLCLIDSKARAFTAEDRRDLRDLATWVEDALGRHNAARYRNIGNEQEAFLRAILNTAAEGIITIDEQGTIESFNAAAVRIFAYPPEEIIGHNIKRLMPEPYRSEHDGYLARFLETRSPHIIGIGREVTGCRKDGSIFPMELAVNETVVTGRRFFTGIVRDISRRKAAEQQLQETTTLQRAVLDGTSYSIISTAPDGTILTFNRAAEQMLGYAAGEVIGKLTPAPFHDGQELVERAAMLSEELGERIPPGFATLAARARRNLADEREWAYLRKDGSRLPVLLSMTALRNADGQITGFLGIAYDISERKKIDRLKNEFVSTVSHELRTPLTSIRGSLGLIAGGVAGPIPPQAARLIDIAHSNSERLVRLINDILDIEKIESGRMQFNLAVQPLRPLLLHAIEVNRAYAEQLSVHIELHSGELDGRVRIDSDRMMQAITNLLSNAAKYSPAQGCVDVALEKHDGLLRLAVSDHGPGIPEEFKTRIFQKFSQADSSDTRRQAGTGLGLAITRSLIKSMGGRIGFATATSGTTFWIDLPEIAENGISLGPNSSTPEDKGARRRPRILHVDDDADILSVVAAITGKLADFDHANDLQSASHLLATQRYDLIILDLTLPDGSGHKLLPMIAALRPKPRVVVFSASDVRHEEAGNFAACLVKSVTTNEDLLTIIKAQIER